MVSRAIEKSLVEDVELAEKVEEEKRRYFDVKRKRLEIEAGQTEDDSFAGTVYKRNGVSYSVRKVVLKRIGLVEANIVEIIVEHRRVPNSFKIITSFLDPTSSHDQITEAFVSITVSTSDVGHCHDVDS